MVIPRPQKYGPVYLFKAMVNPRTQINGPGGIDTFEPLLL